MTRREALKLLQISTIYPELDQVQKQYSLLQEVYNPANYSVEKYQIYSQLLQQLTQAYTKIANEEGYTTFTDEAFKKKGGNSDTQGAETYRSIFIRSGLFGVVGVLLARSTLGGFFISLFQPRHQEEEHKKHKKHRKQKKSTKSQHDHTQDQDQHSRKHKKRGKRKKAKESREKKRSRNRK